MESLSKNDFDPVLLFKKDKNFIYAHQKIKKLVAAVYMITNYFDQSEPIKWSLRKLGMDLLRLNIEFKDRALQGAEDTENSIKEKVLEMVSLLEVASFAGLVSPMNLSILKKEFNELLAHIHKSLKIGDRTGIKMDSNFFSVPQLSDSYQGPYEASNTPSAAKKDAATMLPETQKTVFYNQARISLEKIDAVRTTNLSSETLATQQEDNNKREKLKDYGPVAVKKNKRQSIIINLLKRKKEIMIKDVSSIVSDCSEKTIQRELLALVDQGVLRKEGERRWTKYTLA